MQNEPWAGGSSLNQQKARLGSFHQSTQLNPSDPTRLPLLHTTPCSRPHHHQSSTTPEPKWSRQNTKGWCMHCGWMAAVLAVGASTVVQAHGFNGPIASKAGVPKHTRDVVVHALQFYDYWLEASGRHSRNRFHEKQQQCGPSSSKDLGALCSPFVLCTNIPYF